MSEYDEKTKSGLITELDAVKKRLQHPERGENDVACDAHAPSRRELQQLLQQANDKADAALNAKSVFLATMSHEIRTPLNGVLGMLQLVKTTHLNKEQSEYIDVATRSAQGLLRILADILDLTRIESGLLEMREETFSMQDVIQPINGAFADEADKKHIKLQVSLAPETPKALVGDPARLRQILYNLVGNALKYTDSGHVQVEIYPLPVKRSPEQVFMHFSIRDTGIGVRDEHINDMFDSFTQADGSFSRKYGGMGLGLSIVRNLTQSMGGAICIDSKLNMGTDIRLTIPLQVSEAAPAPVCEVDADSPPVAEKAPAQKRVLLVEDDMINRLTVQRILEKLGWAVSTAGNGLEAVRMLGEDAAYNCVLMDIQMPVMDGVEAAKTIRESGAPYANIPIIAMTAYAMSDDRENFLATGMNDYISKPLEIEALESLLNCYIHSENGMK